MDRIRFLDDLLDSIQAGIDAWRGHYTHKAYRHGEHRQNKSLQYFEAPGCALRRDSHLVGGPAEARFLHCAARDGGTHASELRELETHLQRTICYFRQREASSNIGKSRK